MTFDRFPAHYPSVSPSIPFSSNAHCRYSTYSDSFASAEHPLAMKKSPSPRLFAEDLYGDTDSEGSPVCVPCDSHLSVCSDDSLSLLHERERERPRPLALAHMPSHTHAQAHTHTQLISQHASQQFKCRQLPCRTFISTGTCPYGDRCVFLHDPSITARPLSLKAKRKSADDTATDAFFWPTMSLDSVMGKVDAKKMPHISQPYVVPCPSAHGFAMSNNDRAVFSMWEHFLDFCKADAQSVVSVPRRVPPLNALAPVNPYTGKRRLPVLMKLSQNKSLHQQYY